MKVVFINYIPISLFSNRFHGGKSHLRALLKGFVSSEYFIVQFSGLSKPYINYVISDRILFINIFPFTKAPELISDEKKNEEIKIKLLLILIIKSVVSFIFEILISTISLFNEAVYYERANKSLNFRPLFIKKKILEINDSYIPRDYKWFDIMACVDNPKGMEHIKIFKKPWPCEISSNYIQYKNKVISFHGVLRLIIINTSPYGMSVSNISLFIDNLMKKNFRLEIFYVGFQDGTLNSHFEFKSLNIKYFPILDFVTYSKLLSEMDIAFVTYGESLDINQKRIAVPMKIMDLLSYNIKVFCDQKFPVFEKYSGIVGFFDFENQLIDFESNSQRNLELFFNEVDPSNYVNKMLNV